MTAKMDHIIEPKVAFAPSPEDEKRIRSIIARRKLPKGILSWDAEFGEDSTGDPAVWVWFHFKDRPGIAKTKVHQLADFTQRITFDILDAKIREWPYVGLRDPQE